jgi:hypothetical protein
LFGGIKFQQESELDELKGRCNLQSCIYRLRKHSGFANQDQLSNLKRLTEVLISLEPILDFGSLTFDKNDGKFQIQVAVMQFDLELSKISG